MLLFTVARDGQVERVAGRTRAWWTLGRPAGRCGWARRRARRASRSCGGWRDGLRDPGQRESLVEIDRHARRRREWCRTWPPCWAATAATACAARRRTRWAATATRRGARRAADGRGARRLRATCAARRWRPSAGWGTRAPPACCARSPSPRRAPAPAAHAAEALGQARRRGAFESLRAIALGERDANVARQAVESMETLPRGAGRAGAGADRVAQPVREEAARQAAESLGRFPAPWAVVRAGFHRPHAIPHAASRTQAVESLGGYRGVVPDGYLTHIARTHPDPGVRDEARDQLAAASVTARPDRDLDVARRPGSGRPTPDAAPGAGRPPRGGRRRARHTPVSPRPPEPITGGGPPMAAALTGCAP